MVAVEINEEIGVFCELLGKERDHQKVLALIARLNIAVDRKLEQVRTSHGRSCSGDDRSRITQVGKLT